MLLYEIQATNPYKNCPLGYKKANHGINDLMLFNPAQDQVLLEDPENWVSAVGQIQAAWLDFCYGKMPRAPFEGSDDLNSPGDIYVFPDSRDGRLCQALDDVEGTRTAAR
ncbi:hypothetical protein ACHAP5_012241 [Fusarium lateritium]